MNDLAGGTFERTFQIDAKRDDNEEDDNRVRALSFSSETEVKRWGYVEVLDHSAGSVNLARLNDGHPLLVNHDTDDQIGVIERGSAKIDSDRVGRALVRFSRSQRGEEFLRDVDDEIRTKISVRYKVNKYEVEERDDLPDRVRVTDWEPIEISIVSIPADSSVGVGRSDSDLDLQSYSAEEEQEPPPKIEEVRHMPGVNEEEARQKNTEKETAREVENVRSAATKKERERINEISRLADQHEVPELGKRAIEEDWDLSQFNQELLDDIGRRNNEVRAESDYDGQVDLTRNETNQFSFTRLMEALGNPNDRAAQQRAAFEFDVCSAAEQGFGADFKARGAYIPENILTHKRAMSAGGAGVGAELVGNNLLAAAFIEHLYNAMKALQAGVVVMPGLVGTYDIPRQVSGSSLAWLAAEDEDASETEPSFDQISLSPKDAAVYTEITRRSLQQSTPSMEGLVRADLARAIGLGLDKTIFYGTGANGQPAGIAVTTGINVLDLAAANPTYAEILRMVRLVMEDNALMGSPRFFLEALGWEALSTTPKQPSGAEGNFILGDSGKLAGYDYSNTNQINAEEYFFGDFSQVIMGEWGGLELNVDPYTHSLKGRIRFIVFKTCDLAIRHPEAFCYAHDGIAA